MRNRDVDTKPASQQEHENKPFDNSQVSGTVQNFFNGQFLYN